MIASPFSAAIKPSLNSPFLGFHIPKFNSPVLPKTPAFVVKAARTESNVDSLGFRAPDFELPEPLTGKTWTLDDFEAYPALLVMCICNHCPFVIHLKKDIVKLLPIFT